MGFGSSVWVSGQGMCDRGGEFAVAVDDLDHYFGFGFRVLGFGLRVFGPRFGFGDDRRQEGPLAVVDLSYTDICFGLGFPISGFGFQPLFLASGFGSCFGSGNDRRWEAPLAVADSSYADYYVGFRVASSRFQVSNFRVSGFELHFWVWG